ncbi:serine--tRNA ligase [Candidatus Microgenomates bacterium]|nr:serine--tRNA ligase [Candidatus Microgenomates bacterium]
MIDINYLREKSEELKSAVAAKQLDPTLVDTTLELDKKWREKLQKVEELRKERNTLSKAYSSENIEKAKSLKEELKKLEEELANLEQDYKKVLYQIPNPAKSDVKVGKNDTENDVVRKWGEPTTFDFEPKDHLDLGEKLEIIDVQRASKVSGTRFAYLKGDAVLLEFAIVNFAMETLLKEGFVPVIPPTLITKESMKGMGYMEHGGEEDMYVLEKDDMVLVGTSEQSIGPMHKDEVLNIKDKPLRYVGFSSCFRREAGSYGKDTKGIIRVHQFDKVEMFSFTTAENADTEHEYLLSLEEKFLQSLALPYQVIKMCTGDLGLPAARKYDLEAWIPSQNKYRELTSTSTVTDFQARRLNIKYQDKGETKYAHMLNGTAFAIGRTIVAIMENYQQKDGSIIIPEVLRKWVGKDKIEKK